MKYLELRDKLDQFPKYPGTERISRSPIVHEGFRGNFNISFGEEPLLNRFGNYLDNQSNYDFSTIQQVIRVNDFREHMDDVHLLLFDMSDIAGFIDEIDVPDDKRTEIAEYTVRKTFEFFIDEIGLDPKKFLISYFAGGDVGTATDGKYGFDKCIAADPFIHIAKEFGISEDQLVPDKTRTTLLSLNFIPPAPWGYRNEILYRADNLDEPLDIASIEHLLWEPRYDGEGVAVDVDRWKNFCSFSVVGIERLLMLINGSEKAYEADHITPLIRELSFLTKNPDASLCRMTAELIRVFHRIVADMGDISGLSSSRKEKLIPLRRAFLHNARTLNFDYKKDVLTLMRKNAELQPCFPELMRDIDLQAQWVVRWIERGRL